MTEEDGPMLRNFRIQRMVNGKIETLVVRAENLNAAKLKADEMAGGNAKGRKR